MGLSCCMASCLAEQTDLSELMLDCTMTMTINAVFHIFCLCVYYCVCLCANKRVHYVFVFVMEI